MAGEESLDVANETEPPTRMPRARTQRAIVSSATAAVSADAGWLPSWCSSLVGSSTDPDDGDADSRSKIRSPSITALDRWMPEIAQSFRDRRLMWL